MAFVTEEDKSKLQEKVREVHGKIEREFLDMLSRAYVTVKRFVDFENKERKILTKQGYRPIHERFEDVFMDFRAYMKEIEEKGEAGIDKDREERIFDGFRELINFIGELRELLQKAGEEEVERYKEQQQLKRMFEGPFKSYNALSEDLIKEAKSISGKIEGGKAAGNVSGIEEAYKSLEKLAGKDIDLIRELMGSVQRILNAFDEARGDLLQSQNNLVNALKHFNETKDYRSLNQTIHMAGVNINKYIKNLGKVNEAIKESTEKAKQLQEDIKKDKDLARQEATYSDRMLKLVSSL